MGMSSKLTKDQNQSFSKLDHRGNIELQDLITGTREVFLNPMTQIILGQKFQTLGVS